MIEPRKDRGEYRDGEYRDEEGLLRDAKGRVVGDHIELDASPMSELELEARRQIREEMAAGERTRHLARLRENANAR